MGLSHIWIVFLLLSQFGYAQVTEVEKKGTIKINAPNKPIQDSIQMVPSDTISYKGAVFRIVLPAKYNSKLVPKILRNQIVLVDKTNN